MLKTIFDFILRHITPLLLLLIIANCSPVDFNGGQADERTLNEPSLVDGPSPKVPESQEMPQHEVIEVPALDDDFLVYSAQVLDFDLSLSGQEIQINVGTASGQPIVLFLHFYQPTQIVLSGDTDQVAAVFLTGNSGLAQSTLSLVDGETFPSARTALGFFPNYSAGADLATLIGQDKVDLWNAGTIVESFSSRLGNKTCFNFTYQSSMPMTQAFSIDSKSSQSCFL